MVKAVSNKGAVQVRASQRSEGSLQRWWKEELLFPQKRLDRREPCRNKQGVPLGSGKGFLKCFSSC